jgi:two-component system, NtrC family, response regulator HydG
MPARLLIVDDDPTVRESLAEALCDDGYEVRCADDGTRAVLALNGYTPDVVLADVRMPEMGGFELLRLLQERAPAVDVIVMTAFDDMPTIVAAMREGARDFLVKPLDLHELRRVLRKVMEDRRTRAGSAAAPAAEPAAGGAPGELVGRDARMIEIFKLVGKVAANRTNVLIRGETGTGKELIARAIHFNSADAAEPFVPVNCTALPSTLLESELFGHVRGSFTGAHADRRGRFAMAGRGTIFLDEIGDTSPELQSKLLRVLQEREFYPVGAEQPQRTEARVLTATHRDLEARVAAGEFRADLYYRLRVVEIALPPLRERLADLPLLAEHLLRRGAKMLDRPAPVLSAGALERLRDHPWPGNVRELENCLQRALVLATGDVIRPEHIIPGPEGDGAPGPLATLDDVERAHVARVYAATGAHKSRTAEILGVSRPRLDRLLRRHGLQ